MRPETGDLPLPPIALSAAGDAWKSFGPHVSQNPTTLMAGAITCLLTEGNAQHILSSGTLDDVQARLPPVLGSPSTTHSQSGLVGTMELHEWVSRSHG
jgi:hypothetical protein